MTRSVIDPITRIEGHLRVEMEVTNGKVSDAWVSGGCFRGMEMVVENRTPEDAALYYTIVEEILGKEWLTTDLFRIGASSAANNLLSAIEGKEIKYY